MSSSQERVRLAEETLEVLRRGQYPCGGSAVTLPDLSPMLRGTRLYTPLEAPRLRDALHTARGQHQTTVQVTGEDTFAAARRLHTRFGPVTALNFASAKNPGGGFLGGAKAQEEDLARCSALYLSLTAPEAEFYYLANLANGTPLYTDHLIYSPDVPVFRDSAAAFLPAPVLVNVITAPAPNAGAVLDRHPTLFREVPRVLRERATLVLGLAALMNQRNLILGAWGCGVFLNDPAVVAETFRELLATDAAGAFENVVFAVLDTQPRQRVLRAFEQILG
ncbi:TIGR02452 family protein [Deinococcus yunweiensis]|uniref:TIGR02452 family protein n=1 Tax=Deinococcus yunweiensis TaxID=367282 RepID=UPI00398EC635